jgi:hypothetical protein
MAIPVIDAIQEYGSAPWATRATHSDIWRRLIGARCEAAKDAVGVPLGSANVHGPCLALDKHWVEEGMPGWPVVVERSITPSAASADNDWHPGKMDPCRLQDPIAFRTSHQDLVKIPKLLQIHAA